LDFRQAIGVFIVGVCIGLVLYWALFKPSTPDQVVLYDTVRIEVPVPRPYPVIERDPYPVYDTIWRDSKTVYDTIIIIQPTDTAAILADYYKERYYNDTLRDDHIEIYLSEMVTTNRIAKREIQYVKYDEQNWQLRAGLSIYIKPDGAGFAPMGYYTNDRWLVGLGYDPLARGVFFSTGITLFSR
jgi:hypothetical protein